MASQQWIIRLTDGRLTAPVTLSEIMIMIEEGRISGDEQITNYPGERWQKVAEIPELYAKLMEELEIKTKIKAKEATKIKKSKKDKKVKLEKLEKNSDPKKEEPASTESKADFEETVIVEPPPIRLDQLKARNKSKTLDYYVKSAPLQSSVILNVEPRSLIKKKNVLKEIFPFAVLFIIGAFLVMNLLSSPTPAVNHDRIHLLRPKDKAGSADSIETQKNKTSVAIQHIEKDTFKNILEAQNILVSLVESNPVNLGYRGLLCYTYLELWDYSYKDAQDLKTIEAIAQSTRALNVSGPEGYFCEAMRLYLIGRNSESKVTLESLLNSSSQFSLLPVVYYLRGNLLVAENDHLQGLAFLEKAAELWPNWNRPYISIARAKAAKNEFNDAAKNYQAVLSRNKEHYEALLGLGILNYRKFKQLSVGERFIQSALKMQNKGPRPIMAEGFGIMAEILSERGEKSEARDYAEKALKIYPSSKELKQLVLRLGGSDQVSSQINQNEDLIYRADQYARAGDCLSAQAEYKAAFEANPKFGTAAVKAAQCLWQLYQSYEAVEWLKKAVKAEPKLVQAYVLQADYLSQRYDFTGASLVLNNSMRIAPNNHEVLRGFAQIELRKNNYPGAVNFGLRAMKVFDADPENFVILSKAFRNQALTMIPVMKSDIEKKDQYFRDALRYATKAVELDSTNTEAQINYAQTLAATNGVDTGIAYLKELIVKYSFTTEYRLALADLNRNEERYTQAKELYEQITNADSKNKKAYLGFGISLKALGFNDQALKAFLSAAVVDPTDAEGTYQAAQIYYETGKFKEALDNFLRVRRVNPLYPRANLAIAKSYFQLGDYDQALTAAQDEKKANPRVAESYLTIAEIHMARKQYQECSNEYANALKLRSQDAQIYVKASVCYRFAGSLDVAQDMLDLARQMESGYADIYREQGALFKIKGDAAAAAKSYRMYLELSPNASDKSEVEQALRQIGG